MGYRRCGAIILEHRETQFDPELVGIFKAHHLLGIFRFAWQACQCLILFLMLVQSVRADAENASGLEKAAIQLKWQHSFQFAGYYAAIAQGYYQDEGLDVALKEIDFSKDFVEQVLNGEST